MIGAVRTYVAEVARLATTGKTTEHSFRGALSALIDVLALRRPRELMDGLLRGMPPGVGRRGGQGTVPQKGAG